MDGHTPEDGSAADHELRPDGFGTATETDDARGQPTRFRRGGPGPDSQGRLRDSSGIWAVLLVQGTWMGLVLLAMTLLGIWSFEGYLVTTLLGVVGVRMLMAPPAVSPALARVLTVLSYLGILALAYVVGRTVVRMPP